MALSQRYHPPSIQLQKHIEGFFAMQDPKTINHYVKAAFS
jgi:hypothetical protein